MKKYSLLILSFIISIIIFIILIFTQKNISNQEVLGTVYILKNDVEAYSLLDENCLEEIYIQNNLLINYEFISNKEEILNKYTKYNLKKGDFLTNKLLIDASEIENIKRQSSNENIAIKLDNTSSIYSSVISDKSTINLYISVNEKYLPEDIDNFNKVTQNKDGNNIVTFKYLENISPIKFTDESGNQVNSENQFSSIVINVPQKQAIYLNSINNLASFKVTIN